MTNLEKYKSDLKKLLNKGELLNLAIQYECSPQNIKKQIKDAFNDEVKEKDFISKILSFKKEYQGWYSESLILIKQLLPDRISDFIKLYEKPKARKEIQYGNYVIEDYLQNLSVTFRGETKVGPNAAIVQFEQQFNILKAVERRFESSLFEITQLVQADLLDSEIATSRELNKKGFYRASGVICGVVIEKHLKQVCINHNVSVTKKNPTISEFNDLLKSNDVIDISTWRFIQRLGDLRNLCGHNKDQEPTQDDTIELINGTDKIIKTIY